MQTEGRKLFLNVDMEEALSKSAQKTVLLGKSLESTGNLINCSIDAMFKNGVSNASILGEVQTAGISCSIFTLEMCLKIWLKKIASLPKVRLQEQSN
jgi:hypothetical protein